MKLRIDLIAGGGDSPLCRRGAGPSAITSSNSLRFAKFFIILLMFTLSSCTKQETVKPPVADLTKDYVSSIMRDDSQRDVCFLAITNAEKKLRLTKPKPGDEVYKRGKYWVIVPLDTSVTSEFYDDFNLAMEATNHGVVRFQTCPPIENVEPL